ncbi:serine/threonine protein kinase [Streptomyces zhaozhouensis]|uniref:Serine/threonine protein kinase n=1 Tax=Streptomyces zhaozhouensis TaxID=1300267 RepID=A0A286DWK8_9ACTN|nr:serine/threonine-protein kinase [Streptomyces zhaozhouensis]SOD63067.1 serine/threonine protein kinase [Streptomyces zhaozhouensis]
MADGRETRPERIGDYVIERRLGSGGMGVVHLGRTVAGRQVAIKVIRREYAENAGFRARFRREVAAARRVSGAFTAPVVDADPEGDPPWLATLYVPGGSLTERIDREGPLAAREAARVGAELAEALLDIHRCGLVHRDLKPGNVLLADDGVRVIDFGISRALDDGHRLTEDGAVLGSPPFMAPEQLSGGGEVTAAADVFALGAVVAYAVTGHSPFDTDGTAGGDPLAVAYRVVHEEPDLSDVPQSLRDLVGLCLVKDPEQRPGVAAVLRMAAWADTRAQAAGVRESPVWRGTGPAEPGTGAGGAGAGERRGTRPGVNAGVRDGEGRGGRWRRWAAAAVALVAAGAVATALWQYRPSDDGESEGGGTGAAPEDPSTLEGPAPADPWEVDLRDWGVRDAPTEGFGCEPATDGGVLCSAAGQFTLLLDADGGERWRFNGPRAGGPWPNATVVGDSVIAPSDGGLAALDPASGEVRWQIDAPELGDTLAVGDEAVAFRNGDSTVRFYSADGPDPLGSWEAPGRYLTDLLGHGTRFLAASREDESGQLPRLQLLSDSGQSLWPTPLAPPDEVPGLLHGVGMDEEAAYFEEWDVDLPVTNAVWRLDLATREWTRTELPEPTEPRTVLAEGTLYASSLGGQLAAVDPAAGEVRWHRSTGARIASPPTLADGVLHLSDGDGALHRFSAEDGEPLGAGEPHPGTPGPGSDASPPSPAVGDEAVFVPTLGNTLYAVPRR